MEYNGLRKGHDPGKYDTYRHPRTLLRLPENGQRENLVECQNGRILDDPFELVVVFEHDVWWKIPKESWQKEYQEKMPQYLAIPEESILYLHG